MGSLRAYASVLIEMACYVLSVTPECSSLFSLPTRIDCIDFFLLLAARRNE